MKITGKGFHRNIELEAKDDNSILNVELPPQLFVDPYELLSLHSFYVNTSNCLGKNYEIKLTDPISQETVTLLTPSDFRKIDLEAAFSKATKRITITFK